LAPIRLALCGGEFQLSRSVAERSAVFSAQGIAPKAHIRCSQHAEGVAKVVATHPNSFFVKNGVDLHNS
jgi:hypothetical protein